MQEQASPVEDLTLTNAYQEIPSSWKILWSWLNPYKESLRVPSIMDVLMRTVIINSINRRQEVIDAADLFFQPPGERFGMLEFVAAHEIAEVSYQYAIELLEKMPQAQLARFHIVEK